MPVSAASLANLKAPFEMGNQLGGKRPPRAIGEAISELRRCSPRAVRFLERVMSDNKEATSDRIRCAIALLDKVIPNASVTDAALIGGAGVTSITLKVVRHEQPAAGPVIEGEAEPQQALLSIRTVCQGEGDD